MTLTGWKQKVSLVEQMLNYNFTKYYFLYFFYHTDTADKPIYIFLSKHWNSFLGMIWNQAEFGTREIFLFLKNKCWLNIRLNHLRWRDVFVYFSVCISHLPSESLCRRLPKPSVVFYLQPCTEQVESNCQPLKRDCFLHAPSRRGVQVYLCSLETAKRSTRAVKWMTVKPEWDGSLGVAESETLARRQSW